MRLDRVLLFSLFLVLFNGIAVMGQPPAPDSVASTVDADDRYRIGLQDVLEVQVFRHPELTQRVPVNPNGSIVLYRLDKPIIAACKTDRQLAVEIADAYEEKILRSAEVSVVVADQKSQAVSVIGAVEKPSVFYVNRRVHLLELLAMAGGPNKESGTRLMVLRTGSSSTCKDADTAPQSDDVAVVGFKIRDVQEGKSTFWMKPGDVVSVLDADTIYVYGNVNKQGAIRVREPMTLTQAIVSSEGLKPATKKDKVRILRQRPGSLEREEIVIDLNQIDKGKIRDPFLEPNDIVAISEDKTRSILLGLANSLKSAAPNVLYRIP
jgi:polysaccharide export outer membrane protein